MNARCRTWLKIAFHSEDIKRSEVLEKYETKELMLQTKMARALLCRRVYFIRYVTTA